MFYTNLLTSRCSHTIVGYSSSSFSFSWPDPSDLSPSNRSAKHRFSEKILQIYLFLVNIYYVLSPMAITQWDMAVGFMVEESLCGLTAESK